MPAARMCSGSASTWAMACSTIARSTSRRSALRLQSSVADRVGRLAVGGQQQLEGPLGVGQPPRGVDARSEGEPEAAGADEAGLELGRRAEGGDARPGVLAHDAQPLGHPAAVVAEQGDRVGDGRQGDEVDAPRPRRAPACRRRAGRRAPARACGRPRPRPGRSSTGPAEGGVGEDPRRPMAAREVVVEDDRVHPEIDRAGERRDRRRAAVDAHEHPRASVGEQLDRRVRDAVALGEAARQEGDDLGVARAQRAHQDRGGADAVAVVVAVHGDPSRPHGPPSPGGRRPRRCPEGPRAARAARRTT